VQKPALTDEQRLANEMLRRQRSAASRKGQAVSQERRDKISATLKRRYAAGEISVKVSGRTPEWRAKISAGLTQAYKDGRLNPTGCYKNKWHLYVGKTSTINMRSKSETLFAAALDALGLSWEYEPVRFDLGWSTYTPDFYIADLDLWIEVKGFWREDSLRKVREFSQDHRISAFMARPILLGKLPESVSDLFAGTDMVVTSANFLDEDMPRSKEVNSIGK
jgi:predicted nuclease of restriction endonuclease-like RecB superfamily